MKFLRNLLFGIREFNFFQFFSLTQKLFAYLPLILIPWIFSPLSTDPFFNEKLISILLFSSLSLLSWNLKIFFGNRLKKKDNKRSISNYNRIENKDIIFYFCNFFWFFFTFTSFIILSQIFSINFNQSFWGIGSIYCISILVWLIAIFQIFSLRLVKLCLVLGITILAGTNLLVVITRFNGSGIWDIVKVQYFSANGDSLSLILVLFIGVYLSLKSSIKDKYRYVYISSLFLNFTAYLIYSYFSSIYIFSYIAITLLIFFYFLQFVKFKSKNKRELLILKNTSSFKKLNKIEKKKESKENIGLEQNTLSKKIKDNSKIYKDNIHSKSKSLKSSKDEQDKNVLFDSTSTLFKITIIIASIIVGIFEIILQKGVIFTDRVSFPINFSWYISIKGITDSFKNILFGVGANTYDYSFIHYKPAEINNTDFWSSAYTNSIHGGLELITNIGLGFFIVLIIFLLLKLRKKLVSKDFKIKRYIRNFLVISNIYNIVFIFFLIILFFITPITITSFWCLLVLLFITFGVPQKYSLNFNMGEKLNVKNYAKYFIYTLNLVIIIPIFIFIYYFIVGSLFLSLGYRESNTEKVNRGLVTFPYYPKNFNVAINTIHTINNDVILSNYIAVIKNYSRINIQLNPYDPQVNLVGIDANTSYKPDFTAFTVAEGLYQNLISLGPNHYPYYLSLSDIETQLGSYDTAGNILDQVLSKIPKLNIALIKRANIYYLKNQFNEVKTICNYLVDNTHEENIKVAALSLLDKVKDKN